MARTVAVKRAESKPICRQPATEPFPPGEKGLRRAGNRGNYRTAERPPAHVGHLTSS